MLKFGKVPPRGAALGTFGRRVVLDGELVAGAGTSGDFYGLLPHLVGRRHPGPPSPVSFWAFDVLWLKRLRSIYRPGERTRHWRKLKTPDWSAVHRPRRGEHGS